MCPWQALMFGLGQVLGDTRPLEDIGELKSNILTNEGYVRLLQIHYYHCDMPIFTTTIIVDNYE